MEGILGYWNKRLFGKQMGRLVNRVKVTSEKQRTARWKEKKEFSNHDL
jgi:hypothetical protein